MRLVLQVQAIVTCGWALLFSGWTTRYQKVEGRVFGARVQDTTGEQVARLSAVAAAREGQGRLARRIENACSSAKWSTRP